MEVVEVLSVRGGAGRGVDVNWKSEAGHLGLVQHCVEYSVREYLTWLALPGLTPGTYKPVAESLDEGVGGRSAAMGCRCLLA